MPDFFFLFFNKYGGLKMDGKYLAKLIMDEEIYNMVLLFVLLLASPLLRYVIHFILALHALLLVCEWLDVKMKQNGPIIGIAAL